MGKSLLDDKMTFFKFIFVLFLGLFFSPTLEASPSENTGVIDYGIPTGPAGRPTYCTGNLILSPSSSQTFEKTDASQRNSGLLLVDENPNGNILETTKVSVTGNCCWRIIAKIRNRWQTEDFLVGAIPRRPRIKFIKYIQTVDC